MTHKEYADSLRTIAKFFEEHEELPLPHDADTFNYFSAYTKPEMALVAHALGSSTKEFTDSMFHLNHQFGTIKFSAIAYREEVCERIVVGKKTVPAHVIPAKPEQYIPSAEEDVVEWRCEPILEVAEPKEVAHAEDENIPF